MSHWTPEEVEVLQKIAGKNKGHCDRCKRIIKIYKYTANKQMATILRRMAHEADISGVNAIDFNRLGLVYALGSQRTKMRLHGLIAKFKDKDGKHKASTWVITTKGGDWLRGNPIAEKVVIFDNQVLGHEGHMVTIQEVTGEPAIPEEEKISTPEAGFLHNVRKPVKYMKVLAEYQGRGDGRLKYKQVYTILVEKLQFGKPVKILYNAGLPSQIEFVHNDINEFRKYWHITESTK